MWEKIWSIKARLPSPMSPSAREKVSRSWARGYSQRENKENVGMVFSRERAPDLLSRQVLIKAFEVQEEREKREQTEGIQRGIKEFWEWWICLSSGLWQWFYKCIHRAENIKLYTLNICNLLFVSYTLIHWWETERERKRPVHQFQIDPQGGYRTQRINGCLVVCLDE